MTYREIVYIILDELKLSSDDNFFTEDHIIFLANKFRALLLSSKYQKIQEAVQAGNQQLLCIDLEEIHPIIGLACEGGNLLKSTEKIPNIIPIAPIQVSGIDLFKSVIVFVPYEQMVNMSQSPYTKNIIYCCIAPDKYLYLKSFNPQFLYLETIKIRAVFEDPSAVATNNDLNCDTPPCDILDVEFPLEESLIAELIDAVLKSLRPSVISPESRDNISKEEFDTNASSEAAAANNQVLQRQQYPQRRT